jgi:hypothetical protein
MRRLAWSGAVLLALSAAGWAFGGEPPCSQPHPACSVGQLGPAGGWCPYGGGLLCWWPQHCFPDCGGPDDYCRKPLPKVCWPPYPPYYIWGPPESCCPPKSCPAANGGSH